MSRKLNDNNHCERGKNLGKGISDTSVDSDAKSARDRYIRVAAMDIMVIDGI